MSVTAWLGDSVPRPAVLMVPVEPGVEDVPWAEAMGPVLRERVAGIAAAYDALRPEQRAAVDAGGRWAAQVAIDQGYVSESAGEVFEGLAALERMMTGQS